MRAQVLTHLPMPSNVPPAERLGAFVMHVNVFRMRKVKTSRLPANINDNVSSCAPLAPPRLSLAALVNSSACRRAAPWKFLIQQMSRSVTNHNSHIRLIFVRKTTNQRTPPKHSSQTHDASCTSVDQIDCAARRRPSQPTLLPVFPCASQPSRAFPLAAFADRQPQTDMSASTDRAARPPAACAVPYRTAPYHGASRRLSSKRYTSLYRSPNLPNKYLPIRRYCCCTLSRQATTTHLPRQSSGYCR